MHSQEHPILVRNEFRQLHQLPLPVLLSQSMSPAEQ